MSDSTSVLATLLLSSNQAAKEAAANNLFNASSPAMLYALNPATTTGLTFGYIGGRFLSSAVANGTVSLTNSATNYIVALRATGAVSVSTSSTLWDDEDNYIRLYKVVTAGGAISSYEDHRQAYGAAGSASSGGSAGSSLSDVSLIDRLRGGQHSAELFTLTNGVNEFSLTYVSGTYYLAYDNKTETKLRSASTIAGLSAASDSTPVANGRYPAILFDGSTWHLWVFKQGSLATEHYTAATFTGTYTLSDTWTTNLADASVTRSPIDGLYYAAYKEVTSAPHEIGVMWATNPAGPWTDLGYVFADIGRANWHATEEADPQVIFFGGRAYVAFAGWDGSQQRVGMVEVNPTTMRAFAPAVVLVNPLETWQQRNSANKVFSPIFLSLDSQPGRERLYFSQNPGAAGVATGWGYVEVAPPPNDGRRPQDVMRIETATAQDVAAGIRATLHGSPTLGDNTLTLGAGPAGAYGVAAKQALDDFTLVVEFTPAAIPAGGDYALLCRISTQNSAVNPVAAIWIQGTGARIYAEVKNNAGSGNFSQAGATTTITNGVRYRATLRKMGTEVRMFLNTVQEFSGTHSGSLTGLTEWTLGNQKGVTMAAAQQFQGTIHRAFCVGEALPINRC
jgi:hypothetical protein